MALTLLQIVQTAANELGLNAPSIVVGSSDTQVKQLLALVNRDSYQLFKERTWSFLRTEFIINIGAPSTITGNVTLGSTTVTGCSSTAGLDENYSISGAGLPTSQRISSVTSSTVLEMEMEATATGTGVTLTCVRDTFDLPSDFDHYIDKTWWDRTNHWMLIGPDSPQFTQWLKSGVVSTGPRRHFTQIGKFPSVYRIWPPPTSSDTPAALSFEYISSGWIATAAGAYQSTFTADTDSPVALDQALILGTKWRMWQINGFDYGAFQAEYNDYVAREISRDGGAPDLSMNNRRWPLLINSGNVQDGNFPGMG